MSRLAGALMLAAAGCLAGSMRLRQLGQRLRILRQLYLMLGRIRDEIEFRALPLDEILAGLQADPGLTLLGLEDCSRLWCYRLPEPCGKEERAALEPLFAALGRGTGPEACRLLAYAQNRCLAFTEELEKAVRQAKYLYRPLGLCCGLLLALLLL